MRRIDVEKDEHVQDFAAFILSYEMFNTTFLATW
jgi:hypothetical protein